jgi:hypothetical protein
VKGLIELINKDRVRNDPRQVANALAGLPEVTLMTSLKICGRKANVSEMSIGERALRARIERRHRKFAKKLSRVRPGNMLGYFQALKAYDFRDPKVDLGKHKTRRLQEIWETGVPDWKLLGLPSVAKYPKAN